MVQVAQLTVSVINGSENNELELTYKGNDLGSIESFNYYVENINRGTNFEGNNVSLNKRGIYTSSDDISSNSPSTTNEDNYIISIDWNGNSEDIIINNEFALLNSTTTRIQSILSCSVLYILDGSL